MRWCSRTRNPQAQGQTRGNPKADLLAAAALLAAVLLCYGPSTQGYFVSDDYSFVVQAHSRTHDAADLLGEFLPDGGTLYRPMKNLSFMLDYWMYGTWAAGYRITNLTLLYACALIVYALGWRWLGNRWLAFSSAACFIIFPTNCEPVLWIAARESMLAAFFLLAALLLGTRQTPRSFLAFRVIPVLCGFLALASRESAAILPALVLVHGLFTCARKESQSRIGWIAHVIRQSLWSWIPVMAYALLRLASLDHFAVYNPGFLPPDLGTISYWSERLEFITLLISPVRTGYFPLSVQVGTGAILAFLSLWPLLAGRRPAAQLPSRGIAVFLWAWILFNLLPHYTMTVTGRDFQGSRHVFLAVPAFCIALHLGILGLASARGESRLLRHCLPVFLIIVLLWLGDRTRQDFAQSAKDSARMHEAVCRLAAPDSEECCADWLIIKLPDRVNGAPFGNVAGILTPPFYEGRSRPNVIFHDDAQLAEFLTYLEEVRQTGLTYDRRIWNSTTKTLDIEPPPEETRIRGVLASNENQWRIRGTTARVVGQDALLRQHQGRLVELLGEVDKGDESPTFIVSGIREVEQHLRVPEVTYGGDSLSLQVVGEPWTRYWILVPALPAFTPVRDYGCLLLAEAHVYEGGTLGAEGRVEHTILVPNDRNIIGKTLWTQAIVMPRGGRIVFTEGYPTRVLPKKP